MPINHTNLEEINYNLRSYPIANLLIVTKNKSTNDIQELIDLGYSLFGENKVQEANEKFRNLISQKLVLHLIGPLQTNKVSKALNIFNCIQSVDRKSLIDEIIKKKNINSRTGEFYIQVNIGSEPQKSGVLTKELFDLYHYALKKQLNVVGLMCIPPKSQKPEFYFEKMLNLKNELNPILKLSMGMSGDYKKALEFQSDIIRVGSLIFT